MKTGLSCNHYRVSLHAPCSTLFGIAVYMFQFSFAGYNVKVRRELLSGAIGTFEEENTAYLLVSWLLWVLPMTVTRSSFGPHHWTPEAALSVTFGPHHQEQNCMLQAAAKFSMSLKVASPNHGVDSVSSSVHLANLV